jgi:hypothetical protein
MRPYSNFRGGLEAAILLAATFASMATAQPALVNHGTAHGAGLPLTSSAINMTGANVLAACVNASSGATPTLSDSSSNTWVSALKDNGGTSTIAYYAANATVSGSMTFTLSGGGSYASMEVAGFSALSSNPYDPAGAQGAYNAGVNTVQPGSLTTSVNGELVITCTGTSGGSSMFPVSINSSFTISDQVAYSSGNYYGGAMAYFVQPAAGAINPTWSYSANGSITAVQLAFEPNGAVGSISVTPTVLPANHSGNIVLQLAGTGTSWGGGTTFTVSGVSGVTKVSQSVASATSATLAVTSGSGTGTLTISDGTEGATTTVATETLSVSPSLGAAGTPVAITLTGTNTLWTHETASTLFALSGGLGSTFAGTPTIVSDTSATATLNVGATAGSTTITDTTTGATTSFTGSGCAITTTGLPAGALENVYSQTVQTVACASPAFSVASGLPPGLTIGSSSGTISGTPTSGGNYTFTVAVADANGNTSQPLSIQVAQGCGGYAYSATLTVAKVGATLANFPVVVSLTIPPQYVLSPQGNDICISNTANTAAMPIQWFSTMPLDGPVHEWNWQNGNANFVFNAPSLSASGPTQFTIWAGNPFVLKANPDSTSAWDSAMTVALHLQEPMLPVVNFATNAQSSAGTLGSRVTGQIGYGEQFASANSQFVGVTAAPTTGGSTISALFNTTYAGSAQEVLVDARGAAGSCGYGAAPYLYVANGMLSCGPTPITSATAVDDGAWHYATCTCNSSTCGLYLDGVSAGGAGSFSGAPTVTSIGGACGAGNYFDGKLEEVRIALTSGRPGAWITAEATNLLHPASFVTIGSWSFSGGSGPTISGGTLGPSNGSSSSLLATWTTSAAATSRVLCSTVTGGPYSLYTPMLHPVQYLSAFYGVTSHSAPITGLHAATTYYCVMQSINTSGGWTQSSEMSATTPAALTSTPLAVNFVSSPMRPNDGGVSPSGQNGHPYTGCWLDGDTEYNTRAPNGYDYGMNGGTGTSGAGGTFEQWLDQNHNCSAAVAGGVGIHFNGSCAGAQVGTGPACVSSWTDGLSWFGVGPISVNGTLYQDFGRGLSITSGHCCTSIIKTSDYWLHSTSPEHNAGPSAVGNQYFDAPSTQANSMFQRIFTWHWVQVGADYNSGQVFPAYANDDGWVYDTSADCWTISGTGVYGTGCGPISSGMSGYGLSGPSLWAVSPYNLPVLCRTRIEDMPLQDGSKRQCYTGAQSADDGLYDAQWTYDYTQETHLNGSISNFVNSMNMYNLAFIPGFNRFIWTTNAQNINGLTSGAALYDVQYPWSVPVKVAAVPRYAQVYPNQLSGFGNILTGSYNQTSSSPFAATVTLSEASGYEVSSPQWDGYTTFIHYLGLVPRVATAARPAVSSNSRHGHIPVGLDLFYNFQGYSGDVTIQNLSPNDPTGQYSTTVSGVWTDAGTPVGNQQTVMNTFYYDQYGMWNFGYPTFHSSPGTPWAINLSYSFTTPYAATANAFTAIVVWAHYPATVLNSTGLLTVATPSGETVLSKGGDLRIKRHGSSPNSGWDVVVGGTTVNGSALLCADGSFCAFVVRRDGSGNVTVYRSNSIGGSLPLTADATASVSGAWSSTPLTFGDPTTSLTGVILEALFWHTNLTDAQLIQEMSVIRNDMATRGAPIP